MLFWLPQLSATPPPAAPLRQPCPGKDIPLREGSRKQKFEAEGMFWRRVASVIHHSLGKAMREKELKRNRNPG